MSGFHDPSHGPTLGGATVAHLEARQAADLERLVHRHGGVSWSAPALSEAALDPGPDGRAVIERLASGGFELVVLLTGAGARRLFEEADRAGVLDATIAAMGRGIVVCRGPKPLVVVRARGIRGALVVPEPSTTAELLALLGAQTLIGVSALIVSGGERVEEPATFLRQAGAVPVEVQLYQWTLTPADAQRLTETIVAVLDRRIDAVLFTARAQVLHFFDVARAAGLVEEVRRALGAGVVTGAIGPTCAAALRASGVEPHVVPEHPKLGHLVLALARALGARPAPQSR